MEPPPPLVAVHLLRQRVVVQVRVVVGWAAGRVAGPAAEMRCALEGGTLLPLLPLALLVARPGPLAAVATIAQAAPWLTQRRIAQLAPLKAQVVLRAVAVLAALVVVARVVSVAAAVVLAVVMWVTVGPSRAPHWRALRRW